MEKIGRTLFFYFIILFFSYIALNSFPVFAAEDEKNVDTETDCSARKIKGSYAENKTITIPEPVDAYIKSAKPLNLRDALNGVLNGNQMIKGNTGRRGRREGWF